GADYSVTLSFDVGGLDGPFSGWIQFGVAILDPNQVFNSVRIDSTHLGSANSSLQKDLDWGGPGVDATIMSVNGSTQTTFAAAGQSLLIITDYVTIDTGANVATFVNTFTQKSKVPEPALWQALVGLAAVGLVVRKRGRN
ncbi:MAG: hypothetical protein ACKV0T_12700, partial [Planctomycetales bacterium]